MAAFLLTLSALTQLQSAEASSNLRIGLDDPANTVSHQDRAPDFLSTAKDLGASTVRLHVSWPRISITKPMNEKDPEDPGYQWGYLDHAVTYAKLNGLQILMTVSGPKPNWESKSSTKSRAWKPNHKHFARFIYAVAKRYRKQVNLISIWNEPNHGGWIQPQSECRDSNGKKTCKAFSPHHYRLLVKSAYPMIKLANPKAKVLIGELAPTGSSGQTTKRAIKPLRFLRQMACLDKQYHPVHTGRCKNFKPIKTDYIAYHPHPGTKNPGVKNPDLEEAQLADSKRLLTVLDRLRARKRLRCRDNRRCDVYYTEMRYQTNPPDPKSGVSLYKQSRYYQQSVYLAWKSYRIRSIIFYQLFDADLVAQPGGNPYGESQSGLLFVNGDKKRSFKTFPNPFYVDKKAYKGKKRFWGYVSRDRTAAITLLRKENGQYGAVTTVKTDKYGFFTLKLPVYSTATYRYKYVTDDGKTIYSDSYRVTPST